MHERAVLLPGGSALTARGPALEAPGLVTGQDVLGHEFEALLVECSTLAFRVAYGVLRHREDAEDVAQEAFAKAYRSFHRLRDRQRFRAWLVRTTWRTAIDRYHTNRRRADCELPMPADAAGHESADALERAGRLWQAIDALPEKLRATIVLSGILGHNVREVAALLDVPEGTVKSRLFLARQQLKDRLS
jgi:RNA polymerase sigma-70 factor (ECF subfamily)